MQTQQVQLKGKSVIGFGCRFDKKRYEAVTNLTDWHLISRGEKYRRRVVVIALFLIYSRDVLSAASSGVRTWNGR